MRGRRHVQRRGPLIVYAEDNGVSRAFRNLPGVELAHVDRLNLLQLAPGGHLGRFVIWSQAAFNRVNQVWGSVNRESLTKKGYTLPRPLMHNSDLTRIINSDEIQSHLRDPNHTVVRAFRHKNPITNINVKIRLNPYAAVIRRSELLTQERVRKAREAKVEEKRKKATDGKEEKEADKKTLKKQQAVNYHKLITDESVAANGATTAGGEAEDAE